MFLTRKTVWRKVRSHGPHTRDGLESIDTVEIEALADDSDTDAMHIDDESGRAKKKSKAEDKNNINDDNSSTMRKLRSALSLSSLSLHDSDGRLNAKNSKETRAIRFSSTVRVCLIPSRLDMEPLITELYWLPEDYITFKREAVTELKLLIKDLSLTAKAAISMLYQPSESDTLEDLQRLKNSFNLLSVSSEDTGSQLDLKFLVGIKTDVEMNKSSCIDNIALSAQGAYDSGVDRGAKHLPSKTPSGSGSSLDSVWQASWIKYPQKA